jgi:hypothetical protein
VMRRVLASLMLACLLAVLGAAGVGCAKRHRISVESNSCWIMIIDRQRDAVVNQCGNSTFRVAGEIHCIAVTNLNDTGYVRVRIDDGTWAESSVPRGTAETCR